MTIYICDSCGAETPGGARGTSFLVRPDGKTDHFCSSACLRAYANRDVQTPSRWYGPLMFIAGGLFEILVSKLINIITNHS